MCPIDFTFAPVQLLAPCPQEPLPELVHVLIELLERFDGCEQVGWQGTEHHLGQFSVTPNVH
jgi:hypothetical protein